MTSKTQVVDRLPAHLSALRDTLNAYEADPCLWRWEEVEKAFEAVREEIRKTDDNG